MFVNSDFSDLLRIFSANGGRYWVTDGYAVVQYTEPRYTKDLDVWISTDVANKLYLQTGFNHIQASRRPPARFDRRGFTLEGGRRGGGPLLRLPTWENVDNPREYVYNPVCFC